MSERKHRRHRNSRYKRALLPAAIPALNAILAHPWRSSSAALLSFFLCWAVLTKSLPYVLAAAEPDLALALNPNNPAALVSKAGQVREKLLWNMGGGASQSAEQESGAPETPGVEKDKEGASLASLPKAQEAAAEGAGPAGLRAELGTQIHDLASKAISADPLNAAAYRLLAEATGDPERARGLMREAVKRSRRETAAVFWLLNDSYYRGDFSDAIVYADILLRTRPGMASYGFSYLLNISRDPGGRRLVADWLAGDPGWRREFLRSLWDLAHKDPAALALLAELRNTKRPPDTSEIGLYISYLFWNSAADIAYDLWLRTLPRERLDKIGFLTDPGYEEEPASSLTVFDWVIAPGANVSAEFVPWGRPGSQRLLHLSFGQDRIEFPVIEQALLLPAGHYRLEGKLHGSIVGKRGLRWRISCVSAPQTVLGETEMLVGESEEWRVFTLEADVPQSAECVGQVLRLFHESRSASEEYLSGEAWFGGMRLERTAGQKSAARQ